MEKRETQNNESSSSEHRLGELSRTLLKEPEDIKKLEEKDKDIKFSEQRFCDAPTPCISEDKEAIMILGLNPAGDERDALRD